MASGKLLQSIAWLTAGIIFASLGCGKAKAPAVKTEGVEGLVTIDGQPVQGATVTFSPVQSGVGASATGMTDAEGRYHLTAVGAGAGAQVGAGTLPGEYYVGVMKVEVPKTPSEEELQANAGPDAVPQNNLDSSGRPRDAELKHIVPQIYNDPRKSGIKVTVKDGQNDIPISLTTK